jgi:hypothetical protein
MAVLAGINFFAVEVLTWGLVTYMCCSSFTWRVGGSAWQELRDTRQGLDGADGAQRNGRELGHLERRRYALYDRDTKFCASFRTTLAAGGIRADDYWRATPQIVRKGNRK